MYPAAIRARAPVVLQALPVGDAGTFATVDAMRQLTMLAQANPTVRRLGEELAGGHGTLAQRALRLRDWIDRHFIFVKDPSHVELLTTPAEQVKQIATTGSAYGDCDDAAVLAAALAQAGGLPVRYVLFGFGPLPTNFSHIFAEVPTTAGVVDLDVTRPHQNVPRPTRVLRMGA